MNYAMRPIYRTRPKVEVVPIKVYFKDEGELAIVEAGKAFDHEDAIKFVKDAIDPPSLRSTPKRAFLTVIKGGKNED